MKAKAPAGNRGQGDEQAVKPVDSVSTSDDTWGKVPMLLFRVGVNASAKDVFTVMSIHANRKRQTWVTQETIARALDWWWNRKAERLDTTRVRKAQADLEAVDLIRKVGKHLWGKRRWSYVFLVAPYPKDAGADTASSDEEGCGTKPAKDAVPHTASPSAVPDTAQTEVQTKEQKKPEASPENDSDASRQTDHYVAPLTYGTHPDETQWREALGLHQRKNRHRSTIRAERFKNTDEEVRVKRERARQLLEQERTKEATDA